VSPAAAEAKAGSSLFAEPEDFLLDGGRARSRSHGDLAGIISDDRVAIDLDNPVDTAITGRCINVLFILRFVCPAILNVHTAGLLPADVPVPHTVQRGLLYISQIINNVGESLFDFMPADVCCPSRLSKTNPRPTGVRVHLIQRTWCASPTRTSSCK